MKWGRAFAARACASVSCDCAATAHRIMPVVLTHGWKANSAVSMGVRRAVLFLVFIVLSFAWVLSDTTDTTTLPEERKENVSNSFGCDPRRGVLKTTT